MADTLDQDVQALKEWLGKAWAYLAQPSHTRFDRREMRQQMKLVEEKLRLGLKKIATKDSPACAAPSEPQKLTPSDWRLLKVEGVDY